MRLAPMGTLVGNLIDFSDSVDYQEPSATVTGTSGYTGIAPGTIVNAAPTEHPITTAGVPNWMGSELMWVVNTSSTTFVPGKLVTIDKNFLITALASTAGLGVPIYVTITNFSAGDVTPQGGWVMRKGMAPVTFSVAATAGALYIGTAGNATPTAAAGKQILNATTLIAAATTFTRTVQTQSGSAILSMSTTQGLFPGQTITATGTSGLTVSKVNPDGRTITMSGNATATGSVTATFTPTGYGIVYLDSPFAQGQIT